MLAGCQKTCIKDIHNFSKGELSKDYDLKSQFKRASLSTMNNIAEGFARYHSKEFVRFLDFSQSCSAEVKSMLYVIEDLKYLDQETVKL
jgi:four helix bundle protein